MGKIILKKDTPLQCFAQLRLENGDRILISASSSGVKVVKLKWAGLFPSATLWASNSMPQVAEKLFDEQKPLQRPIDSIIDKLIDCRSAAEVAVRLL